MSSVLTNKGAMIALETLRGINKNLADVQSQISTGKKISTSTDNAAIWSIATVMESDVNSFAQITDSLNLGSATVGVAQSASNQVTNLLQDAKALIVAANDASVTDDDRQKYQTDIDELRQTINNIVDAASFNGQNLLKGTGSVQVLSSLNRQDDGTVTAGRITVNRQNLSASAEVPGTNVASGATFASFASTTVADNDGSADGTTDLTIVAGTTTEDTRYNFTIGGVEVDYIATAGLDQDAIAEGLRTAINTAIAATATDPNSNGDISGTFAASAVDTSGTDAVITLTNSAAPGAGDVTLTQPTVSAGYEPAGGLNGLSDIDITTVEGAEAALSGIDALLQTAIDATADFGSKQKRIDNQNEFIITLTNSLKTGVGAMTDANLEEASARLQSLQVQQQLGTQSLSIANQAPQALLQLFQ
jgi:flagellin